MFTKTAITSALLTAVSAHQNLHQLWINDVTPGYQVGIRMPPSNSPVTDVTSNDIVCNVNGAKGVETTVPAAEGDTIKVQWDQSGHPGPITHMLFGPVDDASTATGVGAGWFKIDELDYVDGAWANEIMGKNNMTHSFTLPTGLPSGEYLLRSEMLALHSAQSLGGAQFYIGCAQLKIEGTGSGTCTPTIELPGAYKEDDANIYIPNVYNGYDPTTYSAPGGAVAACGAGGAAKPTAKPIASNSTLAAGPTAVPTSAHLTRPASSAAAVVAETSAAAVLPTFVPVSNTTSAVALPTTFATLVRPSSQGIAAPTGAVPTGSVSGVAKLYYQCGGKGFAGPAACEGAAKCVVMNEFYSQCLN
jgi:cellulase